MSETTSARQILAPYCVGNGLDIGAGGDPILSTSVCVDKVKDGVVPTHLVGDACCLFWFKDEVLGYVYSSHCLEDFNDTAATLLEWLRVIRVGGNLVLFLPDQQAYLKHCLAYEGKINAAHSHQDFSLSFVMDRLTEIGITPADIVYSEWPFPGNAYSFALVVRKPALPLELKKDRVIYV
jgi:hypothetical protein